MRVLALFTFLFAVGSVLAEEPPAAKLWFELKAKREKLSNLHEEFGISRVAKGDKVITSRSRVIVDMNAGQWRQKALGGEGTTISIFDGTQLLSFDEDGDEYAAAKRRKDDPDPVPVPFLSGNADWNKSREVERGLCPMNGTTDQCVMLEAPLKGSKAWQSSGSVISGLARIRIDIENGVVISLTLHETVAVSSGKTFVRDTMFAATRLSYGLPAEADLYRVPAGMREVKELSRNDASRMRKRLAGRTAPEFTIKDLQGNSIALASLKGRTVLLDFWATWCPPCRADGPALDKLHKKYGADRLTVIGVSVGEDRGVVEQFLKATPHAFSIALTSENELPSAYQIHVLPTYVVIAPDGTFASAVEGDQGFAVLRKMLLKSGLEVD